MLNSIACLAYGPCCATGKTEQVLEHIHILELCIAIGWVSGDAAVPDLNLLPATQLFSACIGLENVTLGGSRFAAGVDHGMDEETNKYEQANWNEHILHE